MVTETKEPEDNRGGDSEEIDRALQIAANTINVLEKALSRARPKVQAFEDLMDSDGTCTLGKAAKIIGWPGGQGEFYRYLIRKRDIFSEVNWDLHPHKPEYFPSETSRKKGYFELDTGSVKCGGRKVAVHTTKVTAPGLDHLRRLIKKDFDLEDDE